MNRDNADRTIAKAVDRVVDDAKAVSAASIPALLCQLGALQGILAARLAAAEPAPTVTQDSLLTVQEASVRLGLSCDWLYRKSRQLPFTVRVGRHLRFSSSGIDRYIRQREGR
jgi:excisionase family DNA binding protein